MAAQPSGVSTTYLLSSWIISADEITSVVGKNKFK